MEKSKGNNMPNLVLNYLHRNLYCENQACVCITHENNGLKVDHKGNSITDECKDYIEFLKNNILPKLNKNIKDYYVMDVGLNDQGNHYPCFFVYRPDRQVLTDLDITAISNEIKKALININKKSGLFFNKVEVVDEKKSILKTHPSYSGK